MSGDVDVEVFFCGLQVHWVVKVHALFILQLPVPPHQIRTGDSHCKHYCREHKGFDVMMLNNDPVVKDKLSHR